MEEKKQDYERLVCPACENKDKCNKECIRIHIYQDSLSMKCPNYRYENSIL